VPRHRGPRERLAPGIYRDARGVSVVAVVAGDHQERRYPADTPLEQLQQHRANLQAAMGRSVRLSGGKPGTLAGDAARYLAAVKAMPSYRTRLLYVRRWVEALGAVRRDKLTPAQIRTQLQLWATTPRPPLRKGQPDRPPLKTETLRHLLKVLRHWYTVLDGRGERNPARDVPMPAAPQAEPRHIPALAIARILRQFKPRSKTRARLAVMATTAMAPAEIGRLTPDHLRWPEGLVIVLGRRKGAGTAPRAIPMTRHSRPALRALARVGAWGPFSVSSMHKHFRLACEAAGYGETAWRPYDLRHSLLTFIAMTGRDERAVQAWAGHTSMTTTARYTLTSVSARVQAAADAFTRPRKPRGGQL
jgi:integrase